MAVQASEEADVRRLRIGGESQRERNLDRRTVRPLGAALEVVCLEIADARRAEFVCVGLAAALKHQHRKSLVSCEKVTIERAERKGARPMRVDAAWVRNGQQFDERARKLNDMVLRAPVGRMAVACSDLKAETRIERGQCIEVAHGMNDMIEAAWHPVAALFETTKPG